MNIKMKVALKMFKGFLWLVLGYLLASLSVNFLGAPVSLIIFMVILGIVGLVCIFNIMLGIEELNEIHKGSDKNE